jgi:uncharacterized RDD family membrane protein YckC
MSRPIAGRSRRLAAKAFDLLLVVMIGQALPNSVGAILGFAYSLVGDGLNLNALKNRSIGKRVFGLEVVNALTGGRCRLKQSIIRNAPIGVVTFLAIFPFWGWILAVLVGIPVFAVEITLIIRANRSQRLGDVMADTEVVEHA